MEIKANMLCYSRSCMKDYRWIYVDSILTDEDYNNIMEDFREFRNNQQIFSNCNHLIVRNFSFGYAIYKFFERDDKDSYDRPIVSLEGFTINGSNSRYWNNNLSLCVIDCLKSLPYDSIELLDKNNRVLKEFDYPIDKIEKELEEDNQNYIELRKQIDKFLLLHQIDYGFSIFCRDDKLEIKELGCKQQEPQVEKKTYEHKKFLSGIRKHKNKIL